MLGQKGVSGQVSRLEARKFSVYLAFRIDVTRDWTYTLRLTILIFKMEKIIKRHFSDRRQNLFTS